MEVAQVKSLIESNLPNVTATVTTDDHTHYNITVIGKVFAGKALVKQQQMVFEILKDHIAKGDIHAVSLKTFTPVLWNKLKEAKEPAGTDV